MVDNLELVVFLELVKEVMSKIIYLPESVGSGIYTSFFSQLTIVNLNQKNRQFAEKLAQYNNKRR